METESPGVKAAPDLLRRYEPVIRSTTGDKFYPMDVEPYVRACSLWVQRPGEEAVCVVSAGELSLDRLAQQPMDEAGAVHFLKFTCPSRPLPRVPACHQEGGGSRRSLLLPHGLAGSRERSASPPNRVPSRAGRLAGCFGLP